MAFLLLSTSHISCNSRQDYCFHAHEHSCCCFFARVLARSALWCCLLPCAKVPAPGRRLDIVPDVVPHAAQPVLKTRHSLGASPHVGDPGRSSLLPSRSGSRGKKETCWWPWRPSVLPSRLHCAERACLLS